MFHKVIDVKALSDYTLEITFANDEIKNRNLSYGFSVNCLLNLSSVLH